MSRYWSKTDAPVDRCNKCGWEGHDWAFKYQGLCSRCYKKWKKERALERKALKPKNDNIEVVEGLIVTKNVRNRLEKQAQSKISLSKYYNVGRWSLIAVFFPLVGLVIIWIAGVELPALIVVSFIFIGVIIGRILESIAEKELTRRYSEVLSLMEHLAWNRQKAIDEALAFYASPEWRLVRGKVIQEQGRVCKECKAEIKDDFDLTVDHIKPRSKFPRLALDISNLRVLCRSCNSSKGSLYEEANTILGE